VQDGDHRRVASAADVPGTSFVAHGDIDVTTAADFERGLLDAVAAAGRRVHIDLTDVEYLGSEGIRCLVKAHRTADELDVEWHLSTSTIVRRAMETAGLSAWLEG
jgi:anti-anti-sigma factor